MQCSGYVKQNQVDVLFESPSDSTGTISITMLRVVEAVGVFGQIGITDLPLYPTVHLAMSSVVQSVEQSVSTVMPILFSTAALSVAPEPSVTPVALSVVPKRLVTPVAQYPSPTPSSSTSHQPSAIPQQQEVPSPHETRRKRIPTRKNRSGDVAKWNSFFNQYRTVHISNVNTTKKVVYLKRGTTGIAGQIIGICDSLFIAMMTDRALQCLISSSTSCLVSSDVITDKYFLFPLPNMYIPLNATMKSQFVSVISLLEQIQTHVPPRYNHKYKFVVSGVDENDPLPNPSRSFAGDGAVLMQTLHVTADRFLGRRYNSYFMERIGLLKNRMMMSEDRSQLYATVDLYYNRCVHGLFAPTPFVDTYLKQYEQQLGNGIRIGVHLRMGAGKSDWTDSRQFLTPKRFDTFIGMLKTLIKEQQKKHGSDVPIRIFLSTDSSTMERTMQQMFPELIVTTKGFKRSHVGGVKATKYGSDSILKAVLDVMLLGKCDYLFLTRRSGFSKIGLYYAEENTSFRLI